MTNFIDFFYNRIKSRLLTKFQSSVIMLYAGVMGLLLYSSSLRSQSTLNISPNAIFDTVKDRFGTSYSLNSLRLPSGTTGNNSSPNQIGGVNLMSQSLCTDVGFFHLEFEPGCGMEGNNAIEIARRNVLCQVCSDLSSFITPGSPTCKVNMLVKNINQMSGVPNSVAGLASSFYAIPNGFNYRGGLIDGQVWQTIISGVDAYANTIYPISTIAGSNSFYHGYLAFQFNSNIQWYTDLSTYNPYGYLDLYSIILHEMTHALGFASLINGTGGSKLQFGYHSRYDMFLKTSNNIPLIEPSDPTCGYYGLAFNTGLSTTVLAPGNSSNCTTLDHTNCVSAIRFGGTANEAVFTPDCFDEGSSLSHFEDECLSTPNNNGYFVMSNMTMPSSYISTPPIVNNSNSVMKRFYKPSERRALCDIGYQVNTTYGTVGTYTYFDYGTTASCSGLQVAGVNDGLGNNGTFTYQGTVGSAINLSSPHILSNDFNANAFECLETVQALTGSISIINGNATFTSNIPGLHLLRYVPYNTTTMKRGNVTYVYVNVTPMPCQSQTCQDEYVNNGGFEDNNGLCGDIFFSEVDCWLNYAWTPDLFSRYNCPSSSRSIPTSLSTPSSDTWNASVNNNSFIGVSGGGALLEAMQTLLAHPLIPGESYRFRCRAKVANASPFTAVNTDIDVCATTSGLIPTPNYPYNPNSPNINHLAHFEVIADNNWHTISIPIQNTTASNLLNLIIANAAYLQPNNTIERYVYLDDISIIKEEIFPVLSIPSTIQVCDLPIIRLSDFASPSNGTFSGDGVSYDSNTGAYSFDPAQAGSGEHFIDYTVISSNGCAITITDTINVLCCPPPSGFYIIGDPLLPTAITTVQDAVGLGLLQNNGNPDNIVVYGKLVLNSAWGGYSFAAGSDIRMGEGAEIIAENGTTLAFDNTSISAVCDLMWRGVTMETGSTLKMTNSQISDAEFAVLAQDGTDLYVNDNQFRNNYVGIHTLLAPSSGNTIQFTVYNNAFFTDAPLLDPYTGQIGVSQHQAYAGMWLQDVIGATFYLNTFYNLTNGIVGQHAKIGVKACTFKDIQANGAYAVEGYGIYSNMGQMDISGSGTGSTDFERCRIGVFGMSSDMTVYGTVMANVAVGVELLRSEAGMANFVTANNIKAERSAVLIEFCEEADQVLVEGNTLLIDNPLGAQEAVGIAENGVIPSKVVVRSNTINVNEGYYGIIATSTNNVKIIENSIFMNRNMNLSAIALYGGTDMRVNGNTITGSSPLALGTTTIPVAVQTGIEIRLSDASHISCNTTQGLYTGVRFEGPCSNTILRGHDFGSSVIGLHITPSGIIGAQPSTLGLDLHGNRWLAGANFAQAAAVHEGATQFDIFGSLIRYDNNSPIIGEVYPLAKGIIFPNNASLTPSDWFAGTAGYSSFDCATTTIPIDMQRTWNANDTYTAEATWEQAVYEYELNQISDEQLYKDLVEIPALMNTNEVAESFYDSVALSATSSYLSVEQAKAAGIDIDALQKATLQSYQAQEVELLEALATVDSLIISDALVLHPEYRSDRQAYLNSLKLVAIQEDNLRSLLKQTRENDLDVVKQSNSILPNVDQLKTYAKTINGIYLNTMAVGDANIRGAARQNVNTIAELCPLAGGKAVFQARALRQLYESVVYDDKNTCYAFGLNLRPSDEPNATNTINVQAKYQLYPNPSTGQMTLMMPLTLSDKTIRFYDGIGRVVYQSTVSGSTDNQSINLETLPSGVYTCKVYSADEASYTVKVILMP